MDNIAFVEDKYITLFNSLIKKGKTKKEESGNRTRYVLN